MAFDKDIRFTDKRVDESYKEQAARDKGTQEQKASSQKPAGKKAETSKPFLNLINSLAVQALMHLGEIPNPMSQTTEINTEAAKELIDLLTAVKEKTSGNLSTEEEKLLESILPELQMKFTQKV